MSRNATHRFSGVIGGLERFMGAAAFPRFTNKCKEGEGGEKIYLTLKVSHLESSSGRA